MNELESSLHYVSLLSVVHVEGERSGHRAPVRRYRHMVDRVHVTGMVC